MQKGSRPVLLSGKTCESIVRRQKVRKKEGVRWDEGRGEIYLQVEEEEEEEERENKSAEAEEEEERERERE